MEESNALIAQRAEMSKVDLEAARGVADTCGNILNLASTFVPNSAQADELKLVIIGEIGGSNLGVSYYSVREDEENYSTEICVWLGGGYVFSIREKGRFDDGGTYGIAVESPRPNTVTLGRVLIHEWEVIACSPGVSERLSQPVEKARPTTYEQYLELINQGLGALTERQAK